MPSFTAPDGTTLAYRALGEGTPVVCVAGGPMQDAAYLGDLGGLAWHVPTAVLDLRGTGASAAADDPASYRCDRLVDDVEALREHLRIDRITLLAHCAGANLAVLYAARFPERVERLALITPSTMAVGIGATADARRGVMALRAGEPWYPSAAAAFETIQTGQAADADWDAITPFTYGRWDDAAQAHHTRGRAQRNEVAAAMYAADGAFDPPATRAALARLDAPVLVLAGEVDIAAPPSTVAEFARVFPDATVVLQPAAGHFPWLDDATAFTDTVGGFIAPLRGHGAAVSVERRR